MTMYAVNSSEITAAIIVVLGVVAFTFSILEVLLDLTFTPYEINNR